MIDFYTWSTPNGRKVSIMLEEIGINYTTHAVDITKDEQFSPDFLAIAPNNKIPAIYDHDTRTPLMESGAILLYLAEKSGQYLSDEPGERWRTFEWLMWQMGGFGPMLGQAHHFLRFNPDVSEYASKRFATEAERLYGVLDKQLGDLAYVAGGYSIADMAIWPWVSRFEWQQIDLNSYPRVRDWYVKIAERPAVQRGYKIPNPDFDIPMP